VLQVDVAHRVGAPEALHFADETKPPGLAAEFAVGDDLQPEALLPADRLDDMPVGVFPRQHRRRAQQAADVLGAERRPGGGNGHGRRVN
jgi:hypothetical protein